MEIVFITPKDREKNKMNSLLTDLSSLENERVIGAPKESDAPKKEKKVKKEKKKKKSKKEEEQIELLSVGFDGVEYSEAEDPDIARMMGLIDIDELMNKDYGEEGNVSDPIISAQRGAYGKRKKDNNEYKKEFAEELTLLYDLLGDTRAFSDKLKNFIDLDGKQIGAVSKTMSDLITNYLDTKKTQLQTLKEISGLKKTAIDLKLKADSKKESNGSESDDSLAVSTLINTIMKTGRGDFAAAIHGGGGGFLPQDEIIDYIGHVETSSSYSHLDDNENEDYENMIERRLTETGYLEATAENDAYLKYEHRDVRVCVLMDEEENTWEFIAVDRDDIRIDDYPLPEKRETEPMKFNGHMAVDRRGVQYRMVFV